MNGVTESLIHGSLAMCCGQVIVAGEDLAPLGGIESERLEDGVAVLAVSRRRLVDVRRILAEFESRVDDLHVLLVGKAGHVQRDA